MADTHGTPNSPKSRFKPEQYAPPAKAGQPDAEKAAQPAATKGGRAAAVRADQQVPRLTAVTVTIDADSAEIVRVEGLDTTGARHELSDEEKARLMREGGREERLAEVVEHAFEAGIASVLGDGEEEETTEESSADAELRHLLLAPLIERSALRHLMAREALNRAILGTLIEHSRK